MPKEVKEAYDEMAKIAKQNKPVKDINKESGIYFYAPLTKAPVKPYTFQELK